LIVADDTGTDGELHYLNGFRDGMLEAARLLLAAPTSTHGSRRCDVPGGVRRVHDHATSADGDPQHVWNTYALRDFVTAHMLDQLEALGFPHPDERTDR